MLKGIKFKSSNDAELNTLSDNCNTTKNEKLSEAANFELNNENGEKIVTDPSAPVREEWMLGDFDTILASAKGRVKKTKSVNSDIIKNRELNPFYQFGGTGLPESEKLIVGPTRPEVPTLNRERSIVGDGGRSWRERAAKRLSQKRACDTTTSPEYDYENKSETSSWRKNDITFSNNKSSKHIFENFRSLAGAKVIQTNVSQIQQSNNDHPLNPNRKLNSERISQVSSATNSESTLHNKIRKDLVEVRILEDVDGKGRFIPILETNRSHKEDFKLPRKRRETTTDNIKEENDSNHTSIESLYRQTRIEGVEDYEKNFHRYIMNKGRRYKDLQDEDDEIHALGRWEKKPESQQRKRQRERKERTWESHFLRNLESKCLFCRDAPKFQTARGHTIISNSPHAYVCYQSFKQCVVKYHLFISPATHIASTVAMDEDVYLEIRNYQKSLIRALDIKDIAIVFIESMLRVTSQERIMLGGGSHLVIDCFGIPIDQLEEAKTYFTKSLSEIGSEWSQHKKIINVPKRSDGCRSSLPKDGGMAHVIEDNDFPKSLGRDVIQGMMGLDSMETYFKTREEHAAAVGDFKKYFEPYDWTKAL